MGLRCVRDHILLTYLGYSQKLKTFLDYFCIFHLSSFEDNFTCSCLMNKHKLGPMLVMKMVNSCYQKNL